MDRMKRTLALALLLATVAQAVAEEKRHAFRGGQFNEALEYEFPWVQKFAALEDEGLRLHFPVGTTPDKVAGVRWRYQVRGDFVSTVRYEVLHADRPRTVPGLGIEFYVALLNPGKDGIVFSRTVEPKGD